MEKLNIILYVIPFLLFLSAILYLVIAIRSLLGHQPTILNSKIFLFFYSVILIPVVILSMYFTSIIDIVLPLFLILIFIYRLLTIRGYHVYGFSNNEFRNAIIYSLEEIKTAYVEKMNAIELIDINNELNISFAAWLGTGTLRIKKKKDNRLLKELINNIKKYCKMNKIIADKKISIFFILFGIAYIIFGISLFYFIKMFFI